jgi:hypothetical protein
VESLRKEAKYLTVQAVSPETKTVSSNEGAENYGRKRLTPVTNAIRCPARTLTVWTDVTASVMT